MRLSELQPEFVDLVPPDLEEGVLYVSMTYGTAIHLCACGCGEKAVTPLTPTDWKLIFDGETVSLWPSIGNWSFDCRSHYIVKKNKIRWAEDWSRSKVKANRDRQRGEKQRHFEKPSESSHSQMDEAPGLFRRLRERFHL
ncbi:MAG: DUF6527 family protein [Solirubrobacterales bacterium]